MELPEYVKDELDECRKLYKKWCELMQKLDGVEDYPCMDKDKDLIYKALIRLKRDYKESVEELEAMYGVK